MKRISSSPERSLMSVLSVLLSTRNARSLSWLSKRKSTSSKSSSETKNSTRNGLQTRKDLLARSKQELLRKIEVLLLLLLSSALMNTLKAVFSLSLSQKSESKKSQTRGWENRNKLGLKRMKLLIGNLQEVSIVPEEL